MPKGKQVCAANCSTLRSVARLEVEHLVGDKVATIGGAAPLGCEEKAQKVKGIIGLGARKELKN